MIPMLADRVSPKVGNKRLLDDNWWTEQKFDGKRVLILIEDGEVTVLNRRGEPCGFNVLVEQDFKTEFRQAGGTWVFDGEMVGSTYWIFDMPRAGTLPSDAPFHLRRSIMESFFTAWNPPERIRLARCAKTTEEKEEMLAKLAGGGAEGIMLKRVNGLYFPGKRSDSWAKYKFWKSCEVVVLETGVDGKSNARMAMIDPDSDAPVKDVGTVSTLGKWAEIVEPGCVLEVKYLYAVDRNSPKLYQPNILRVRDDKPAIECTLDQLEFTDKEFQA